MQTARSIFLPKSTGSILTMTYTIEEMHEIAAKRLPLVDEMASLVRKETGPDIKPLSDTKRKVRIRALTAELGAINEEVRQLWERGEPTGGRFMTQLL